MKMDEKYSNATYGGAGITAFFASLSLQDWGFIAGVLIGALFTALTYFLNRREQMKRTRILQEIADKVDAKNPSTTAQVINELAQKTSEV
ncbi:hypothetical protein A9993_04090 [Rahnella victoriana]|uniref:HP1 family phage holin n=1 Tax=Rahnella victoriana TaxID=1510570 RepID=UPI000BB16913|nr:HP1 family phage holin [Rahnella victoriana]PBI78952.1 hypothetical protein A9993_04090 [Rahnella victoriana]